MTLKDHIRPLAALATNAQPGRAAAYRHFFWGAARRTLPAVAVEDQGMRFYLDTTDHIISRQTFIGGVYELDAMKAALSLIEDEAGISLRGRGFIDVGANIGTTTIPAMKLFGAAQGLAMEPSTVNVRRLRINLLANDLEERVHVLRAAASDSPGELELELNGEHNHGDNRLRMGTLSKGEFGEERWETETVPVTTLDESAHLIEDPAVLWIDTQGHEGHVLAGAKSLGPIPTVIEYWPYALRRADGLELLQETILARYEKAIDVRESMTTGKPVAVPLTEEGLSALARRYPAAGDYTDLVLL